MATLMLAEIIEKLNTINKNKQEYRVADLRNMLLELSKELEKISDNLLI